MSYGSDPGFGVGFGAQNIINNYISGWILMWERPIRIGDFLEFEGVKGTVESINTRSTRLRRTDGVHLMVPNSMLLENTVVNWTLVDQLTRTEVKVGVAYGSPVRQVSELLGHALESVDGILADPGPRVLFDDFGESSLDFAAIFWVKAADERGLSLIQSELRYRISDLFATNDIVIAFPQRDVHLDGAIKVETPRKPRGR
jgi:small-conductance mechanosensitive channel